HAEPPVETGNLKVGRWRVEYLIYLGTFVLLPIAALLIHFNFIMDYLLASVGILVIGFMIWMSFRYERVERQRIWVIIILLIFTTIFWTFFELAGSALNLFTDKNVNKKITDDLTLTTTFFQAVNPFFIMIFAPLISALWIYMG